MAADAADIALKSSTTAFKTLVMNNDVSTDHETERTHDARWVGRI